MTTRDAHARITPYELGFPGREFAERWFSAIGEEVAAREVDPSDPGAFLLLGEVGRMVRELQGEDRGPDALRRFGALVYHGYHFHDAGEPLLLLETPAARYLVDGSAEAEGSGAHPPSGSSGTPGLPAWTGELPEPAGYLQLPRHLFWVHSEGEGVPEPLDGFFWTRAGDAGLALTAIAGIRGDRPGFSILPLPPVPLKDAGRWVTERIRSDGADFATTLPGGELDRLYSLLTTGELLKLAALVFAYRGAVPHAMGERERAGEGGVHPTTLEYRRLRLVP